MNKKVNKSLTKNLNCSDSKLKSTNELGKNKHISPSKSTLSIKVSKKDTKTKNVHKNNFVDDFEAKQIYHILDSHLEKNEEILIEQNALVEKYEKLCKRISKENSEIKYLDNDFPQSSDFSAILEKKSANINESLTKIKNIGEELENIKNIQEDNRNLKYKVELLNNDVYFMLISLKLDRKPTMQSTLKIN